MSIDDDANADWMRRAPLPVLQCRDLRHAWPRETHRSRKHKLPSSEYVSWLRLDEHADGAPVLERTMWCTGGCGVRRAELFVVRAGALVRVGTPKLRYPAAYLRRAPAADTGTPVRQGGRLDPDQLRGTLIGRLYPDVKW